MSVNNPCLPIVLPIFAQLSNIEIQPINDIESEKRTLLIHLMDQCINHLEKQNIETTHIRYIHYAMVASMDEHMMTLQWEGRWTWMAHPLQLHYFGDYVAGEQFFERLSQLQLARLQSINVLEIYYVCLLMGFSGKYRNDSEKLEAIKNQVCTDIHQIREVHTGADIKKPSTSACPAKKLPIAWHSQKQVAFIGIIFLVTLYLGHYLFIQREANASGEAITAISKNMLILMHHSGVIHGN